MEFNENKHSLNFSEMDSHHKEFIDIYNSIDSNNYKNVMTRILEQTKIHFCHEEELMKKHNYPRVREHTDEHKKVLYEMEYFINSANSVLGKKLLKSYYNEALLNWFESHLLSMDSDLASFLKNIQ